MKSYTDLEQSKLLAEILPLESADNYYSWHDERYYIVNKDCPYPYSIKERIPCWSLVALLELMPFQIIVENNRFGFYQVKGFNKQGETYRFGYKTNNDSFLFETSWHNDVLDAAFEMICWLKENNKL